MTTKKTRLQARIRSAVGEYLDSDEEPQVCADMLVGSFRMMAFAPWLGRLGPWPRHFVVATNRRLLLVKATRWRGRAMRLASADDLSSLRLEEVRKGIALGVRRHDGEVFYMWGSGTGAFSQGRWRDEVRQLAQLLPTEAAAS